MPSYKFTLHSGQTFTCEDKRELQQLSADLCSAGFLVVQRTTFGYSTEPKPMSLLERAVASIEAYDSARQGLDPLAMHNAKVFSQMYRSPSREQREGTTVAAGHFSC